MDVFEIQVDPFFEDIIVPESPTAMNIPLPYMIPFRLFEVTPVLDVQVEPSVDDRIIPALPTATKILFPYDIPLRSVDIPEV